MKNIDTNSGIDMNFNKHTINYKNPKGTIQTAKIKLMMNQQIWV